MAERPGTLSKVLTSGATEALRDLSDYVEPNSEWRLVGGAAIRFYTGASNPASELDVVTRDLESLPPPDGTAFVFAHRHLPRANGHYAAILHNPTVTKIDVFSGRFGEAEPLMVPLDDTSDLVIPVRDPNTQMVVSLEWLRRRVDEGFGFGSHQKHMDQITALAEVVDWQKVREIWQRTYGGLDLTAAETMHDMLQKAAEQGGAQQPSHTHRLNMLRKCADCDHNDPDYPLVPGWQVAARMLYKRISN